MADQLMCKGTTLVCAVSCRRLVSRASSCESRSSRVACRSVASAFSRSYSASRSYDPRAHRRRSNERRQRCRRRSKGILTHHKRLWSRLQRKRLRHCRDRHQVRTHADDTEREHDGPHSCCILRTELFASTKMLSEVRVAARVMDTSSDLSRR